MRHKQKTLILMGLSMATALLPVALADFQGIVITQGRDQHINVAIDPSLLADARVRRRDDSMIIELPDSAISGGVESHLKIAPGVKESANVEIGRSARGTAITIHSSNVYLSMQPSSQVDVSTGVSQKAKSENAKAVSLPSETKLNAEKSKSLSQVAIKTQPTATQTLEDKKAGEATVLTAVEETEAVDKPAETQAVKATPTVNLNQEGDNGLPLAEIAKHQPASVTSDGTIWRVILGCGLVLVLLLAFIKKGLPMLLNRFPHLNKGTPQVAPSKTQWLSPLKDLSQVQKQMLMKKAPPGTDTQAFQILASTSLGAGKEVHLIQLKDRQLVVGATPYNINLLTEMDVEEDQAFADDLPSALYEQPTSRTTAYVSDQKKQEPELGIPTHGFKKISRLPNAVTASATEAVESAPSSFPDIYKKYTQVTEPSSEGGLAEGLPHPNHSENEVEQVILLSDYDDQYSG